MEQKQIWVVKESGEREPFDRQKARGALRRTGMSGKESDTALARLEERLHDGITTKKIYAILYEIIEGMKPQVSHKFNLKRALFDIGPEGYEFEDFIGKLLVTQGYGVELRQIMTGMCVSHEIDVLAQKNSHSYSIECKFHNQYGTRCRIQTALYVYARFLDLREGSKKGLCKKVTKPWLITNTKFSEDVIRYAECMDFPLLGWRYPLQDGLETLIDRTRCYPVTVIPMSRDIIGRLLSRKIVTIADIPENAQGLSDLSGIPLAKAREVVERAEYAR